jgi:uncharacterized membrane protein YvlD (DUF360 family)
MMKLLWRVLVSALAIFFVLPMINGIQFHGNFAHAIALGAFFALMMWVVAKAATWATAVLGVVTFGLALVVLIPMWIFGWWLLPAFALQLVAYVMPDYLSVSGFGPAVFGGLVMLAVSFLTGSAKVTTKSKRD